MSLKKSESRACMFSRELAYLGVSSAISTDDPQFCQFLSSYLSPIVIDKPVPSEQRIRSRVLLSTDFVTDARSWDVVGYRLNLSGTTLRETVPSVTVTASVVDGGMDILVLKQSLQKRRGGFRDIRQILLQHRKQSKLPNYQSLLRYAWHFPLFAILESQGFGFLHATAVAREGRALIFTGLAGSGKSTLALAMLELQQNWQFVTDNYLIVDKDLNIHAFPEPLRANTSAFCELWGAEPAWSPSFSIAERRYYLPDISRISGVCLPAAIFVVTRGSRTRLDPVSPDLCARQISGIMQWSIREFHWSSFCAFLPWIDEGFCSARSQGAFIMRLTQAVPCFNLTVGTDKSLRSLVEQDIIPYV